MGRPRKPIENSSAKISLLERENRARQEAMLNVGDEELKPPTYLDSVGKKEFKRIVENCKKNKTLDNLDLAYLIDYSSTYSSYIAVGKALKKEGRFSTNAINPKVYLQLRLAEHMMKLSTKLGLAVTDRLKLVVQKRDDKKDNKFLKYASKKYGK